MVGPVNAHLCSEFRFHPTRGWRFDFAFPAYRLAIEIDGRARGKPDAAGRHQTVDGVRKDCEKNNAAVRLGWRILRFPATDKHHARQWAELVRDTLITLPLVTNQYDQCAVCGCTEDDCSQCADQKLGQP